MQQYFREILGKETREEYPNFRLFLTRIFFNYLHWFCSQNFRILKVQLSFFEQFGTFPRYLPSFGRFQNFWSNGGERAVPIPQLFAFEEVSRTLRFLTTFIWDKLNELGYVDLMHSRSIIRSCSDLRNLCTMFGKKIQIDNRLKTDDCRLIFGQLVSHSGNNMYS